MSPVICGKAPLLDIQGFEMELEQSWIICTRKNDQLCIQ